jgi:arylsulfatase A-like enzyme
MDELTLDFAWRGVQQMQLGQRGHTDLLAVSLSTTDAVGHRWGPESREMHDHILRLDRSLGQFLDSLITRLGEDKVLIAFTSDHGVAPSPDMRSVQVDNSGAQRVMLDDFEPAITASATRAAQARFPLEALDFDGFTLSVDRSIVRGRDRDIRNIAEAFAKSARTVPGVLRVDLLDELAKADTVQDAIARRWLHMFRPGGDVAAVVTLQPYSIFGRGNVATHGSPHDYDAHVPLIFWGAPFRTARDDGFVRVVDLAPTIAAVLGVRVTEKTDGVVLQQALRERP